MLRDFSTHYVSTACLLMSNTNTLDKRWHPVPGLLHVGIDFARYCTNVRPAFLRNGGQKMLSVVNILVYRWLEYQHPIMVCISARNWSSMTNVPWLFRRSLQSIALLLVTFENQKMTQPKKKKKKDLFELPCRNHLWGQWACRWCKWDLSWPGRRPQQAFSKDSLCLQL